MNDRPHSEGEIVRGSMFTKEQANALQDAITDIFPDCLGIVILNLDRDRSDVNNERLAVDMDYLTYLPGEDFFELLANFVASAEAYKLEHGRYFNSPG